MTHAQRGFTGRSITELTAFQSTQTTLSIRQFGSHESIRLNNFSRILYYFFFVQFIEITINIRIDKKIKNNSNMLYQISTQFE